jgi:hypothetical protein
MLFDPCHWEDSNNDNDADDRYCPSGFTWEDFQGQDRERECVFCGKRGLHWAMTSTGWRLYNGATLHNCLRRIDAPEKAFDGIGE